MNNYQTASFQMNNPTAVALGTFDGLHIAHQKVIAKAVASSHPSVVFAIEKQGQTESRLLQPLHKLHLLEEMGVDHFIQVPLSSIMNLTAEEFFQTYLVEKLQAKEVVCGFNFRFGKNAAGDLSLLEQLCEKAGITLTVVPEITLVEQAVSSTRVRAAIAKGDFPLVTKLLGRPYGFTAQVQQGRQLGRILGFPTLNQQIPTDMPPLPTGVYAVLASWEGNTYMGVCNVGKHPTIDELSAPLAETYLLDFQGDAYGKNITLSFIEFLRPERTFGSLDKLQYAIELSVLEARQVLKEYI